MLPIHVSPHHHVLSLSLSLSSHPPTTSTTLRPCSGFLFFSLSLPFLLLLLLVHIKYTLTLNYFWGASIRLYSLNEGLHPPPPRVLFDISLSLPCRNFSLSLSLVIHFSFFWLYDYILWFKNETYFTVSIVGSFPLPSTSALLLFPNWFVCIIEISN